VTGYSVFLHPPYRLIVTGGREGFPIRCVGRTRYLGSWVALKSGDIEANVTARFATYWQDGKKILTSIQVADWSACYAVPKGRVRPGTGRRGDALWQWRRLSSFLPAGHPIWPAAPAWPC